MVYSYGMYVASHIDRFIDEMLYCLMYGEKIKKKEGFAK